MTPSSALYAWSEQSSLFFFSYNVTAGRLDYLNPAFQDFLGLTGITVDPSALLSMVHPEDVQDLQSRMSDCLNGKAIPEVECRLVRGREERWLRLNPFLYEENGHTWLMGNGENVSVYKERSENLNSHNNKKNSILNILAHDLAGPIGTVGNVTDLLRRETAGLNNPKLHEYIGMVSKISKSCSNLIRDFINQEFLESQGVKLLKKRVELVRRITTVTQEYLNMQKELKLQFLCHANREVIYVDIDEDKFLQVINNLISNAMKFTPDNGTITINIEEGDRSILVTVADTGIGIPQKYQATLFDKFSDARRSGLRGEQSTGLGMSIIKTIVEWHEGKIWFRSEENKGTTFYIELPKR